jgi:hypothetical protein
VESDAAARPTDARRLLQAALEQLACSPVSAALVRARVVIVLLLSLAPAWLDRNADGGDQSAFAAAGELLFSSRWLESFDQASIQAGPLQIAFFGGLKAIDGSPGTMLSAVAVEVSLTLVLLLVLRLALPRSPGLQLLGGLGAVALQLASSGYVDGHPAQLAIPLMWVSAVVVVRERPWVAGLLVGGSAGWETWGTLGVPLLLLASGRRRLGAAAAATCAVLVLFGPFLLAGSFHSTSYAWLIQPGTLPGLLVGAGKPFGWSLRALQGSVAVAAGVAVAWRWRSMPTQAAWAIPLVIICTRLALDPLSGGYYWVAPQVVGLIGLALLAHDRTRRLDLWAAAYLPLLASVVNGAALAAVSATLLLAARPPRLQSQLSNFGVRSEERSLMDEGTQAWPEMTRRASR